VGHAQKISLVPQHVDLALYAGDGASLRVSVNDPQGAPVPVTGTVKAQIKTQRTDTAALADFAVDLSEAVNGIVTISLTGTQTAALVPASDDFNGFWDVENTPSSGAPITFVQGKATCVHDVSR